jgi:hypothetical protein
VSAREVATVMVWELEVALVMVWELEVALVMVWELKVEAETEVVASRLHCSVKALLMALASGTGRP